MFPQHVRAASVYIVCLVGNLLRECLGQFLEHLGHLAGLMPQQFHIITDLMKRDDAAQPSYVRCLIQKEN